MFAFLAFGTVWFFVVCAVVIFGSMAFLANDRGWGVGVLLAAFGLIAYFANPGLLESLRQNLAGLLIFAAIYIPAGVGWSLAKWAMKVKDSWRAFKEWEEKVPASEKDKINKEAPHPYRNISELYKSQMGYDAPGIRPAAKDNKGAIISWMTYWPFSVLNFVLLDAMRRLGRFIYEKLARAYDKITDSIYPEPGK